MKKKIILFGVLVLAVLVINSINFIGCDSGNPISPGEPVSFSRSIQPIFAQNCSFPGCHNSTDKQAGIDLTSWESLMINGSTFGAEVVPFNSRWSHMMLHINRVDTNISPFSDPLMPQAKLPFTNGEPLAKNHIETIRNWIDQGAKNDYGIVAFSGITRKAFITNQASDFVAVVNLDNNRLTRLISVGGRTSPDQPPAAPHVIIADRQGRYFYVSLIAEGYIEKFDAMTYEKLARMSTGTSPAHIVITEDGNFGYFSNFDATANPEKNIKKFDTRTMEIVNVIRDDSHPFGMWQPHGLRLSHDGARLVCATEKGEFVYVISTTTDQITDIIPIDPTVPPNGSGSNNFVPYQVAITPNDNFAFISCLRSNDVRVLDLNTMLITHIIPAGLKPLALEVSPDGNWCYVPNQASNSVTVIDVNTMTVFKTISNVGGQPHNIDFTEDSHYAYVTCESTSGGFVHHPPSSGKKPGTTAVIDVWGGHVKIKDIEMASFPASISITPGPGN